MIIIIRRTGRDPAIAGVVSQMSELGTSEVTLESFARPTKRNIKVAIRHTEETQKQMLKWYSHSPNVA